MSISFCGLPVETTETVIDPNASNGLKDKLIVKFDRPYSKQIYGSKKEKLERDAKLVALVPVFLESVYSAKVEDTEESNILETFEQWRDRLAFQRASILLMTRARGDALKTQKMSIDTVSASLDAMSSAGRIDMAALASLEATIAALKLKLSA